MFDRVFGQSYNTRLQSGGEEPLYSPAPKATGWHCITFTRDYYASALHEVAHWCIAGPERRQCLDYGYWYAPDGRDRARQRAFEQAEVKPQALEWVFSRAARFGFRLSADNLDAQEGVSASFKRAVWLQARDYCVNGLPRRADAFASALAGTYGAVDFLDAGTYRLESL
ncbi:MAG: elongation factor P hydroxylase [Cellvibrionaceae bacterium]